MPSQNCPNCKAPTLSLVRAGLYVECTAEGCYWSQAPSENDVIEAALLAWRRNNPLPEEALLMQWYFKHAKRYVAPDEPRDAEQVWCAPC